MGRVKSFSSMTSVNSGGKVGKDYTLTVVGCSGVGKTALTTQFIQTRFNEDYDPTMEDSYTKQCTVDEELVSLAVIDTANNQDVFSSMRDPSIEKGDGFMIVFSLDSKRSFQEVEHFYEHILRVKDELAFPVVLVGNKSDLETSRQVEEEEAMQMATKLGCPYIETSAKSRHNIERAFYILVRQVRNRRRERKAAQKQANANRKKSSCNIM